MSNNTKQQNIEEDYEIAYRRNIAIGDMWLKQYPIPDYDNINQITFDFDPNSKYQYYGVQINNGNQDRYMFIRIGDGALAYFTQYSHIQLKI